MAATDGPFVVGIGMSAGGIEALEALLRATPADSGMAFVVIAHLAPGHESTLADIVGRFTAMPVRFTRDGDRVEPNSVYVVPPDVIASLEGGGLRVRGMAEPGRRAPNPIDAFFGTLANDRGERAAAVVLSGAGSDGTLGVRAVKERGGLTVAQGPGGGTPPRHTGMPSSAIAGGLVDLVLPAEEIPAKLAQYARGLGAFDDLAAGDHREQAEAERLAAAKRAIHGVLRERVGHDFSGYKEKTFLRRVARRVQVLQLVGGSGGATLDAYVEHLRQDPEEATLLFRDLLIGVTSFFRDPDAFDALERLVIPRVVDGKGADDTVRVWVPGCATGEEVYSIAILVRERLDALGAAPKVQIFATDIDGPALDVARAARYPAALLDTVSPERLKRFFSGDGGTYLLAKRVRDLCVFSPHSVVRDPPFSRIDLVSCRNLLIYLNGEKQGQVIPIFHYALRPSGFLFLGSAENVAKHTHLFASIDKKNRIFQRRDHVDSPVRFPSFVPGLRFPAASGAGTGAKGLGLLRTVEGHVLDRHVPPHVVVNRDGDVVHFSPRTGKYLEPPAGQPSRQILALARKGLRLDLRAALQEVMEIRRATSRAGVEVEVEGGRVQRVDLTVEPLPPDDAADPLFLILLADSGPTLSPEEAVLARSARDAGDDAAAQRLDRELRDTRERLQSIVEEYETALEELRSANEELVSVNEELQSTNEELETSKEEIQSVNEELHTVNHELIGKIDELNQANNELYNLVESTEIALIFVDHELIIRSFTPAVAQVFNLRQADRGRPLADIAVNLDYPDLHRDLEAVLESGRPTDRRVERRDGRAQYLARIAPHQHADGSVDGLVLAFVDATSIAAAERRQRTLVDELNHRVRNMLTVVMAIATQTLARTPSPDAFAQAFLGRVEALARTYGLVAREQWGDVALDEIVREELEPHLDGAAERVATAGPALTLRPKAAVAMGMVLHELGTNAAKYGALSLPEGRVEVTWDLEGRQDGRRPALALRWKETGGPPVEGPAHKGFGTELIERQLRHELDGEVTIEFSTGGVEVSMLIPAGKEVLQ